MSERLRHLLQWLFYPQHLFIVLLAFVPLAILLGWMDDNARNIPRFDQYRAIPIALATADGELRLQDLIQPAHGHITFFTFAITALNTMLTDWNLRTEAYVNVVLAVVNYGLYLALFWKTEQRLLVLVLLPFSMLVFSIQQDFNWIIPYDSTWHISIMWFVLAFTVLVFNTGHWWALAVAALLCVFATFSHGNGFLGWGGILAYLLLAERRRWLQMGAWTVGSVLVTGIFLWFSLPTTGAESEAVVITDSLMVRLWNFIVFMVAFVGSVFSSLYSGYPVAVRIGTLGLVTLLVNVGYIGLVLKQRNALRIWLPIIAYGLAVGLMVAVTRLEQHEPERVFLTWYTTPAMLFWLGWLALAAVTMGRIVTDKRTNGWERGLLYVNIAVVVFLTGRYVAANYNDLEHPYSADIIAPQREDCYMRYIFQQRTDFDSTCVFVDFYLNDVNQMAARRLSLYAHRDPESILTNDLDTTLPILVETHTPWLNVHIRDFFLSGVEHDRIHHVYQVPADDHGVLDTLPTPLTQGYSADDAATVGDLLAALGDVDSFWHIARSDHQTQIADFWDTLAAQDYLQVDAIERNDQMIVSRFQQFPPLAENDLRFGDHIRLRAITYVDREVAQCDTIQLDTFWLTEASLDLDYSANLVIVDATGNGVVSSDAALSLVGTKRWEPGNVYADQRTLTVPCDLQPGDYDLMFGIYFYQAPNDKLLVSGDNLAERDDLALITEITIVENIDS